MLHELDEGAEVLKANQSRQVMELVAQHPDLDLVLLDLKMPEADGIESLRAISQQAPLLPVAILSASEDRHDMQRALDGGAVGFIPKSASAPIMLNALRLILAGGKYIPSEMMIAPSPSTPGVMNQTTISLTPRQQEVLKFIIEGISNKQIAARLDCTEGTVKVHVTAVLKALGVRNRTQAAVAAKKLGLHFD